MLLVGRDVVLQLAGGERIGACGVGRDVHLVEADIAHHRQRALELRVGLAGEADDEVGDHCDAGDRGPDALDQRPVLGIGVAAPHVGQHVVVACLEWQIHILHHAGQPGDGVDDALAHVVGVGREETDARQLRHAIVDRLKEVGQVGGAGQVVAVRIDVLAQQRHLAHAPRGQHAALVDQLVQRPRGLASPAVRDDAEGTELVAAVDDGNVRRHAGLARDEGADAAVGVDAVALADVLDERRELLRAHEDVDERVALAQLVLLGADHAAHEGQRAPFRLLAPGLQARHHADDAVLGVLAHDAAVEDDDVGFLGAQRLLQAELLQRRAHALGVRRVHLAADRPEVELRHVFVLKDQRSLLAPR